MPVFLISILSFQYYMKDKILRETMAVIKSDRYMFIQTESWCIENLAWDFSSELKMCFGREWNLVLFYFQGFYMFVKDTHLQKHLGSWFLVLQPKIAVHMNSSPMIFIKIRSKVLIKTPDSSIAGLEKKNYWLRYEAFYTFSVKCTCWSSNFCCTGDPLAIF